MSTVACICPERTARDAEVPGPGRKRDAAVFLKTCYKLPEKGYNAATNSRRPGSGGAASNEYGVRAAAACAELDLSELESITTMSSIEERVSKIVAEQLGVKEEDVQPSASFVEDLGADSLDTVELVMALEEEFETEIPDEEAEKITTVQLAIDYIKNNLQ